MSKIVKVERFKTIQTDILDSVIALCNVMCICMYMQFEILIICSNSKNHNNKYSENLEY